MRNMLWWCGWLVSLGWAGLAGAQSADAYRGGWEAGGSEPHIYEFSIRGQTVRGIYCTRCSDATTLAFVDGTLGSHGLLFTVTHVRDDGSTAYTEHATGTLEGMQLVVRGKRNGASGVHFTYRLHKDPRGPDPLVFVPVTRLPRGTPPVAPIIPHGPIPAGAAAPWVAPGPWEQLTPAKVAGVWIGFGTGINKQYFIIRRVGKQLRGMVCGRCDNPFTMTALDDFRIEGDTMRFNILHEDWGDGDIPFYKHVTVHIVANEMRALFQADHPPKEYALFPKNPHPGTSLIGPIAASATAGNGL
jgi:hypothetical protein